MDRIFECRTCGDAIGEKQKKNVVYMCDVVDGEWCGACFERKPCCYKPHSEGCSTMMIGEGA